MASEPSVNIGSIARQWPTASSIPGDRERKLGTCGSSCIEVPMPCPTYWRMMPKPPERATSSTAPEMEPIRLPGTAAAIPAMSESRVACTRPTAAGLPAASPPQMKLRAPSPCQPS